MISNKLDVQVSLMPIQSVILVDDEPFFNRTHRYLLGKLFDKVSVHSFTKAESALSFLKLLGKKGAVAPVPDLILVDLNMPGIDGFQFMDELQKFRFYDPERTRVLVISSTEEPEQYARAVSHPVCSGVLSKPISAEILSEAIGDFE